MECSSLTSIDFSSTVTSVDLNVFNDCPSLNSIIWDRWTGSFRFLSSDAFSGVCPTGGIVTITNTSGEHSENELLQCLHDNGGLPESWLPLPDEVYNIDENNVLRGFTQEFLDNPSAYGERSVMQIPARVRCVADNAFFIPDSSQPTSTIPSFITKLTFAKGSQCSTIGQSAFRASGTSGQEPGEITYIDLSNCTNLLSIGQSGFCRRNKLTSIKFPNNLSSIGMNSFGWCYSLTTVNLSNCNNLSSIGMYAFFACPLSTPLDLSKYINLTSIDAFAFFECKSHSITFPGSLQIIGDSAFEFCRSIEEIIWNNLNSAPIIGVESFKYIPNTGHVKSTGNYTSSELLSLLKEKGGLLSSWEVAKD